MQRALVLGAGDQAAALAAHMRAAGLAVTEAEAVPAAPFDLLLCAFPESAAQAAAAIEAFAAAAPKASRDGADLRPGAQVIVLMTRPAPAPSLAAGMEAAATEALIRQAALNFAPDLRVNAIALGPVRPRHPAHFAAWEAHQPGAAPSGEGALLALFDYLRGAVSVTGQTLILDA